MGLRTAELRMEFFDVGAVVYFLRKVIWFVTDFTVEKYRDRLKALHERIQVDGAFASPRAAVKWPISANGHIVAPFLAGRNPFPSPQPIIGTPRRAGAKPDASNLHV